VEGLHSTRGRRDRGNRSKRRQMERPEQLKRLSVVDLVGAGDGIEPTSEAWEAYLKAIKRTN